MSAHSAENALWQEHLERVRALHGEPATDNITTTRALEAEREAEETRRSEWTAGPPGRLGRLLMADIERYAEFFAIARAT
jgi:hypothetical protein